MNEFLKQLEKQDNLTTTQNGAVTHKSTLDANLDLFSKNLRYLEKWEITNLVLKAIVEDSETFTKNVLHLLDIRGGKGERKAFKVILEILASILHHPVNSEVVNITATIIKHTAELGRHDYWIDFTATYAAETFKELFAEHKDNLLMYKWMPSTRGSRKRIALWIQNILEMSERL